MSRNCPNDLDINFTCTYNRLFRLFVLALFFFLFHYIILTGILKNLFRAFVAHCPVVSSARGEIRHSLRKCAAYLDSVIAYPAKPLGARARANDVPVESGATSCRNRDHPREVYSR